MADTNLVDGLDQRVLNGAAKGPSEVVGVPPLWATMVDTLISWRKLARR